MEQFAKKLMRVMKGYKTGFPKYFDLSDEKHRQVVNAFFIEESIMQEQYPILYKSYSNAAEQGLEDVSYQGFCDGAVIYYSQYNDDSKTISASGMVALKSNAKKMFISLSIMDGDRIIGQKVHAYTNRTMADIQCETDAIESSSQNYMAYLYVVWEEANSQKLCCMATQSHEIEVSSQISVRDAVKKITVYDPTKNPHEPYDNEAGLPTKECITVAYNRAYSSQLTDYYYAIQVYGKDNLSVHFPIRYLIELADGYTFKQTSDLQSVLLASGGTVFCNNLEMVKIDTSNEGRIEVTFDDDWKNAVPASVKNENRYYDLHISHDLILLHNGRLCMCKVSLSSLETMVSKMTKEDKSKIELAKLYLLWGCLAEGTKILMADGSEKKIQDISVGDKLRNSKGDTVSVTDIIIGTEKCIYRIYMESGKQISASLLHPFAAEQGDVLLRDFNGNTKLKVKDGEQYIYESIINCYPEKYDGKVYSLELEDNGMEKTIIADGFVTYGNSEVERVEKENYIVEDIILSANEQDEFSRLKNMLQKRSAEI